MASITPVKANLSQTQSISILTLNVWGVPIASNIYQRFDKIAERITLIKPDIVVFQEVVGTNEINYFKKLLQKSGYQYNQYFKSRLGSGIDIFSKFALSKPDFEKFLINGEFYNLTFTDFIAGKGIGYVTVETDLTPINLVATHLISTYNQTVENDDNLTQTFQLVNYLKGISNHYPTFVVGDFNATPDGFNYKLMTNLGDLIDLTGKEKIITSVVNNNQKNKVNQQLDYIFLSPGNFSYQYTSRLEMDEKVEIDGEKLNLSDHFGILSKIEFTRDDNNINTSSNEQEKKDVVRKLDSFFKHEIMMTLLKNLLWFFLFIICLTYIFFVKKGNFLSDPKPFIFILFLLIILLLLFVSDLKELYSYRKLYMKLINEYKNLL